MVLNHQSEEEALLLDWTEEACRWLGPAPAVPAHGDFWPGNVLDDHGSRFVIDWETLTDGSPVEDLYTYYAGAIARVSAGAHDTCGLIWEAFYGTSRTARFVSERSREVLRKHGMDISMGRLLFASFLVGRLASASFALHPAWRVFVRRFVREGMPAPFVL
jgi:hypothetical protein